VAGTPRTDNLTAQRERENANEDDLAAFFALDDQITAAAQVRDAALADVARTHAAPPPTPTRASRTACTNSTTGA